MPLSLKREVYNHCILPALTYGAETWSITKQLEKKLRTTLREDSRMGQTWALVDLKQKKGGHIMQTASWRRREGVCRDNKQETIGSLSLHAHWVLVFDEIR